MTISRPALVRRRVLPALLAPLLLLAHCGPNASPADAGDDSRFDAADVVIGVNDAADVADANDVPDVTDAPDVADALDARDVADALDARDDTNNANDADAGTFADAADVMDVPSDTGPAAFDPARATVVVDRTDGVVADGVDHATATVTLYRADGTPMPGLPVTLDADGAGNTITQPSPSDASGRAVAMLASTVAETKHLSIRVAAPSGTLTLADHPAVTFVAGAASALVFSVEPSNVSAGAPIAPAVRVAVEDAQHNTVVSYAGSVALVLGGGAPGASLGGTTTVPVNAGIASFMDLAVDRAAVGYILTASSGSLATATSTSFDVIAGPPARLRFSAQPSSVRAGNVISPAVQVSLEDALGNSVAYSGPVTLAVGNGAGVASLAGTATVAATNGVATFTDLSIARSGLGYTLAATAAGYAGAESAPFDVLAGPADASASGMSIAPGTVTADGSSVATITVSPRDRFGNPVAGTTVQLDSSGGAADSLAPAMGTTGVDGNFVAAMTSTRAEMKNVTAAVDGLMLSAGVTFVPGPAAQLVFATQPSNAVAGVSLAPAVRVDVLDAWGNALTASSASVTLAPAGGPAGWALSGTTTGVAADGTMTFDPLSIARAGVGYALLASSAGLASATSARFDITPAAPSVASSALSASPTRVVADGVATATLTLTVRDAFGNPVPGVGVQWTSAGGASDAITALDPSTDASGVARATVASTRLGDDAVTVTFAGASLQTTLHFVRPPCAGTLLLPSVPSVRVGTGSQTPTGIAFPDMNNDGRPDLVASYQGTQGGVTVALNNGNATFRTTASPSAAARFTAIAPADFNGDGNRDLAVIDSQASTVVLYLGNGDGTVRAPASYTVGGTPQGLAVGDFNRDGRADVAVVYQINVGVLLGNGDGTLQPTRSFALNVVPSSVDAGDFNGDGAMDLVVGAANYDAVEVLLGNGDGTFGAARSIGVASEPTGVVAADFDGDRRVDVLWINNLTRNLSLVRGNGDGTFGAASTLAIPPGDNPQAVRLADMNRDGVVDVVVADGSNVTVFAGRGAGAFATGQDSNAGTATRLALADLNGDGTLDVGVVGNGGIATMLLGRGDGTLLGPAWAGGYSGAWSVVHADFDGDGVPDVAAAMRNGPNAAQWAHGNGDGTFASPVALLAGNSLAIATGDFDDDGHPDLAVADLNANQVTVLRGDGRGSFSALGPFSCGTRPIAIVTGDWNGDGRLDVATANSGSSSLSILLNTGGGMLGPATSVSATQPGALASGDWNRDGKPDLASVSVSGGQVSVFLGTGAGGFTQAASVPVGTASASVRAADLNADGNADLMVLDAASAVLRVALGRGDGTFLAATTYPLDGSNSYDTGVGDLDNDGNVDVAVTAGYGLDVLLGVGDGTFKPPVPYPLASPGVGVDVVDLDRDGRLDVLSTASYLNVSLSRGCLP